MTEHEQRLINQVNDAFAGVTLGKGIGLWEGNALDDYADAATMSECRRKDERSNWLAIPVDDLNFCHCCLSYLDAEGMRFLLPAYLVAELERTYHYGDTIFHLVNLQDGSSSRFDLLTHPQRAAVREFLKLRRRDPDWEFDCDKIDSALAGYWSEQAL